MSRICFFRVGATPLFIPGSEQTFGGAEVRAYTFARALAQHGRHEVSFAVRADRALSESAEGIELIGIPKSPGGLAKLARSLRRRLGASPLAFAQLARIEADLIACFGIHDPTPSVVRSAEMRGMKTLLFLTSSEDVREITRVGSSRECSRENAREFALRRATRVVAQTEYQQAELRNNFGVSSELIRNPIDCELEISELQQPRTHVLWVGRADTDSKRADLCLELAGSCPDIPFRMVMNDAETDLGRRLRSGRPSNVTIESHIPFAEIERLYAAATVLINTSVSEGFPNAFLQAAKFATPIVALNVDPDGMLSKHGCGEMAETLPKMVDLVRQYHFRDQQLDERGKTSRAYVLRHHELEGRVAELEALIKCTLSSARAA